VGVERVTLGAHVLTWHGCYNVAVSLIRNNWFWRRVQEVAYNWWLLRPARPQWS